MTANIRTRPVHKTSSLTELRRQHHITTPAPEKDILDQPTHPIIHSPFLSSHRISQLQVNRNSIQRRELLTTLTRVPSALLATAARHMAQRSSRRIPALLHSRRVMAVDHEVTIDFHIRVTWLRHAGLVLETLVWSETGLAAAPVLLREC